MFGRRVKQSDRFIKMMCSIAKEATLRGIILETATPKSLTLLFRKSYGDEDKVKDTCAEFVKWMLNNPEFKGLNIPKDINYVIMDDEVVNKIVQARSEIVRNTYKGDKS